MPNFVGTNWLRENLKPFWTQIKQEIQTANDGIPTFIDSTEVISTDSTLLRKNSFITVDTANVVLVADQAISVDNTFFYIHNTSIGQITFESIVIQSGSRVGVMYDSATSEWIVFIKNSTTNFTATLSHLVGFFSVEDDNDSNLLTYHFDVIPILDGTTLDTNKYNLLFDDGTPSWVIVSNSPTVQNTLSYESTIIES